MMLAQDCKGRLLEVVDYGKSMYGGWYCNFRAVNTGRIDGLHDRTLAGLCGQLNCSKVELMSQVTRLDN